MLRIITQRSTASAFTSLSKKYSFSRANEGDNLTVGIDNTLFHAAYPQIFESQQGMTRERLPVVLRQAVSEKSRLTEIASRDSREQIHWNSINSILTFAARLTIKYRSEYTSRALGFSSDDPTFSGAPVKRTLTSSGEISVFILL